MVDGYEYSVLTTYCTVFSIACSHLSGREWEDVGKWTTHPYSMGFTYSLIQWEATTRLDFLWRLQAQQEVHEMRDLREHNECLLHNILPAHVARHFLERNRNDQVHQNHI